MKANLFRHLNPSLLLDVGARHGESIVFFRSIWPKVKIVAFEPRREAVSKLRESGLAGSGVFVFPIALGSREGLHVMNVHDHEAGGGSSLLEPAGLMRETRSWAREGWRAERVMCRRLDDVLIPFLSSRGYSDWADGGIFAKIDVQGYEYRVILGGPKTFSRVTGCVIEIYDEDVYEGAVPFLEVDRLLREHGLVYAGMARATYRGRIRTWCDHVWLRPMG